MELANVYLSCGHGHIFHVPPRKRELLWCQPCRELRQVIATAGSWFTECVDCAEPQVHDTQEAADRWATTHVSRQQFSGHIVEVYMLTDPEPTSARHTDRQHWITGFKGRTNVATSYDEARTDLTHLQRWYRREPWN
jgi:hypothetical protein